MFYSCFSMSRRIQSAIMPTATFSSRGSNRVGTKTNSISGAFVLLRPLTPTETPFLARFRQSSVPRSFFLIFGNWPDFSVLPSGAGILLGHLRTRKVRGDSLPGSISEKNRSDCRHFKQVVKTVASLKKTSGHF